MHVLPFREDLVQYLADHRLPGLTPVLQAFTDLGEIQGYILLIALVFVAYDKRLAIRLAVLTLVTMSFNHIIKTLIANPRPFMGDGSYLQKWAVSPERAADLATEYSTPSGHAMAAGSFYGYLVLMTRDARWRALFVALALLIGLSRPYLGVHYAEDVLVGWVLGAGMAIAAVRYGPRIEVRWRRMPYRGRVLLLLGLSAAVWVATWAFSVWSSGEPPSAFVSYAGLLTGVLGAQPLEARFVRFDPRSGGPLRALARYAICVGLMFASLELLKLGFGALADPSAPMGHLLRFIRYASAAITGLFLAPLLFMRLGLATRTRADA